MVHYWVINPICLPDPTQVVSANEGGQTTVFLLTANLWFCMVMEKFKCQKHSTLMTTIITVLLNVEMLIILTNDVLLVWLVTLSQYVCIIF